MDTNRWIHDPVGAFRTWQETAATGADRRPFAPRSVVQHVAMFERFLRYLTERRVSLATFGPDHVVAFLAELDRTCAPGTSTRVRYAKLIDRLGRHLVDTGVRTIHPAGRTTRDFAWPDGGRAVLSAARCRRGAAAPRAAAGKRHAHRLPESRDRRAAACERHHVGRDTGDNLRRARSRRAAACARRAARSGAAGASNHARRICAGAARRIRVCFPRRAAVAR